ncbi:hypothetical protein ACLM5H_02080 [Fredinandcohnia humi]
MSIRSDYDLYPWKRGESKLMRIFIVFLYFVFFLAGCNSHQLSELGEVPRSGDKNVTKSPVPVEFLGESRQLQTLDITGESFNTVGEWYDNESILYVSDNGSGSSIYKYNIFNGEKELFLETKSQVLTMKANEDHSLFLLHTSNSNNQATLIAVNKQGTVIYEWDIESYDVSYSWNPYETDQVFVTSFLEDWSFQTQVLDLSNNTVTKHEVFQPFIQWIGPQTISYLKWDQNELGYFAPLHSYNLVKKTEALLFENIISFAGFHHLLVTYELDNERDSHGKISFYNTEMNKKLHEFSIPLLSDYSKWYIPSFNYVTIQKKFYSFRPYSTGSFDTYSEKFDLVAYDMVSGSEEVVLEKIDDLPLSFSPEGYYCLYGYQLENIIDLKNKKVMQLVTF